MTYVVHDPLVVAWASRRRPAVEDFGRSTALSRRVARRFEDAYGHDLSDVRIHPDSPVPASHNGRAVTLGDHIAFGPGHFAPNTTSGMSLLGHELAHVIQQRGGIARVQGDRGPAAANHEAEADAASRAAASGTVAPQLSAVGAVVQGDRGPVCSAEPLPLGQSSDASLQVCRADPGSVAPKPSLLPAGTAQDRIAAFKSLVRSTAVLRIEANRENLAEWSSVVMTVLPMGDLGAAGLIMSAGAPAYFEAQTIRDPQMRELRANQAEGRFRACTGCHVANQIWATRSDRERPGDPSWLTPDEQRAVLGAYQPAPGGAEARMNRALPNPKDVEAAMDRARPVLQQLGPERYDVLPRGLLEVVGSSSPDEVRRRIAAAIAERRAGYNEVIAKIRSGSFGYEHFGPIIHDLLPLVDADVREAIESEMRTHDRWELAKTIVLGVLTIGALLLAIFPPTSVLGLAALGTLEIGLATYGAATAPEMIRTGRAYSALKGAHDVITPAQQQAGDMMVLGGFMSIAMAPLGVAGGIGRMSSAITRAGDLALLGLESGQTLQRGSYLMTLADDGALVVTVMDRPDVIIIVRNGVATAYQRTAGGGLRLLESEPLMVPGGASGKSTGGTPFESELPHVRQKKGNWCGAACGKMAAERLGVTVSQEELAAHKLFTPKVTFGKQTVFVGGFDTTGLATALEDVAPAAGREWRGVDISMKFDITKPADLATHLGGYIKSTGSSVILRVRGFDHWIVIDEVTTGGKIAVRDPGLGFSQLLSAEELSAMRPLGHAVMSFPKK